MNNDDEIKLSKFYDPEKMRKYIRFMEFFAEIMITAETPDVEKQAKLLFEHYRRMVLNQAVKEFPTNFQNNDVLELKNIIKMIKN